MLMKFSFKEIPFTCLIKPHVKKSMSCFNMFKCALQPYFEGARSLKGLFFLVPHKVLFSITKMTPFRFTFICLNFIYFSIIKIDTFF